MLIRITLMLAILIAAAAIVSASAGPRGAPQAVGSYGNKPAASSGMSSGGGNLVTLW